MHRRKPACAFGPEVIEGADIVLLSHTHWDHITDLAYVMEKFHCPVLCGELSAPALIEMLNANPHDVYPVTPNLELDFGGARVRALFARHTNQHCTHADLTDPAHQRRGSTRRSGWRAAISAIWNTAII